MKSLEVRGRHGILTMVNVAYVMIENSCFQFGSLLVSSLCHDETETTS